MGFIKWRRGAGNGGRHVSSHYWDTALAASDPVLRMLRDIAGIDHVLYGTDFPYLRRDLAAKSGQRILQSAALDDREKHAVLGKNAAQLLPRALKVG